MNVRISTICAGLSIVGKTKVRISKREAALSFINAGLPLQVFLPHMDSLTIHVTSVT